MIKKIDELENRIKKLTEKNKFVKQSLYRCGWTIIFFVIFGIYYVTTNRI